jgi:hypothetical protein
VLRMTSIALVNSTTDPDSRNTVPQEVKPIIAVQAIWTCPGFVEG